MLSLSKGQIMKDLSRLLRPRSIAVLGAGANGSMVTETLARMGARNLTVIDPDRLETHNLAGADLVGDEDLHRFKAEVVAARVHALLPNGGSTVTPVVESVLTPAGRAALGAARVVFSAVDNDAARLTAAVTAVAYHQVLIDIACGIYAGPTGEQRVGADLRLIVPLDGCLLCWGHLRDFAGALEAIYAGGARNPEWFRERAGSLRSLNQIAVGIITMYAITRRTPDATLLVHTESIKHSNCTLGKDF